MAMTPPPRWVFAILACGGSWACGLYSGIAASGAGNGGTIVRVIIYGVFTLLMLWGVLGKRP